MSGMIRWLRFVVGCALCCWMVVAPAHAIDHGFAQWNRLLAAHVRWNQARVASTVDYAGLARERAKLKSVLDDFSALTRAEFARMSRAQRLASLINAYNAFTIELVLTRYPDLMSIKDLGSLIRSPGAFDEPRIHMAVVCASIGCPALRPEAFVAERLETQLGDGTRRFLRDRSRNRCDAQSGRVEVSRVFDWHRGDFEKSAGSLERFLARYVGALADDAVAWQVLREGRATVSFLEYDWSLNDRR